MSKIDGCPQTIQKKCAIEIITSFFRYCFFSYHPSNPLLPQYIKKTKNKLKIELREVMGKLGSRALGSGR